MTRIRAAVLRETGLPSPFARSRPLQIEECELDAPGAGEVTLRIEEDNDGLSYHYAFFGQDEWRLSPKLTLSYGLRYELHPGYYDKYGDIGNFDPTVPLAGRVIYPQGKLKGNTAAADRTGKGGS